MADALDHYLLGTVGEVGVLLAPVAADEGMGKLVDPDCYLGVGGEFLRGWLDADVMALEGAVAERGARDLLDADGVADRGGEVRQRLKEVCEAVSLDWRDRRVERDRAAGELRQRVDLVAVLSRDSSGPISTVGAADGGRVVSKRGRAVGVA